MLVGGRRLTVPSGLSNKSRSLFTRLNRSMHQVDKASFAIPKYLEAVMLLVQWYPSSSSNSCSQIAALAILLPNPQPLLCRYIKVRGRRSSSGSFKLFDINLHPFAPMPRHQNEKNAPVINTLQKATISDVQMAQQFLHVLSPVMPGMLLYVCLVLGSSLMSLLSATSVLCVAMPSYHGVTTSSAQTAC